MKTIKKLFALISFKSKCNCSILQLYHGVIENIHQEQMIQFISEGKKQFSEIGGLLKMTDKYTDKHLKRLVQNGLVAKVLINTDNPTIYYYFLTADGILLGVLVNTIQKNINKEEKLLTRLLQLNIDNNKK